MVVVILVKNVDRRKGKTQIIRKSMQNIIKNIIILGIINITENYTRKENNKKTSLRGLKNVDVFDVLFVDYTFLYD